MTLGSARVSLVGLGVSPRQSLQKVRVREDCDRQQRETRALPGGESELRRIFQQLDHALQQSAGAAAIEAAMIETKRNLRLGYWNEF